MFHLTRGTLKVGKLQFKNGVVLMDTTTAPVNGTSGTGVRVAGKGSWLFSTAGAIFVNMGTKASPTWQTMSPVSPSASPSVSPSVSPS